jgi:hypothetical protein
MPMDYFVIKNKTQAEELCRLIMQRSMPFKVALQDILPQRSIESNDYLWGFIYTPIANHTGHSADEVHEAYKLMFNFKQELRYNKRTRKMQWYIGAASTTGLDEREIWDYIEKVRADAWLRFGLVLMMPNEVFTSKLDFSKKLIKI